MKLLVFGGRDFSNYEMMCGVLDPIKSQVDIVIQGGANGADDLAARWARSRGIHFACVPALWDVFGKAAGHRRNGAMLTLEPDYYIGFPGGRGTADMAAKCEKAGILGILYTEEV